MKKVVVTGANGFIGAHTLQKLCDLEYDIFAIYNSSHPDIQIKNLNWIKANLLNSKEVEHLFNSIKPTHLLHFAWNVQGNYRDSLDNFDWLKASIDILLNFKNNGGQRAVLAGTCFQYEFIEGVYNEIATPKKPQYIYGIAKEQLQNIFEKYCKATGLSGAWGYIFHLYGDNEIKSRLIASVINSLLKNEETKCSSGEQIRNYLYVKDVAGAFAAILDSEIQGGINVAANNAIAVKDLVLKIGHLMNKPELIQLGAVDSYLKEPEMMIADTNRLYKELNWKSEYDLESGLIETIKWWQNKSAPVVENG